MLQFRLSWPFEDVPRKDNKRSGFYFQPGRTVMALRYLMNDLMAPLKVSPHTHTHTPRRAAITRPEWKNQISPFRNYWKKWMKSERKEMMYLFCIRLLYCGIILLIVNTNESHSLPFHNQHGNQPCTNFIWM